MTSSVFLNLWYFIKERLFQILFIATVLYLFYDTIIYYNEAPQFYHLKHILGSGLFISRATASVLNISCAVVLLPVCKKLNKLIYRLLSRCCPGLFFFWLEKAKSCHVTAAATLVVFAVIHSVSHFVNLWNFSRHYDETLRDINLASYKNENPVSLLLTLPGLTGVSMLLITTLMGMTSLRVVRRRCYNAFWYTHHLYLPFIVLLLVHPLSGLLKERVMYPEDVSRNSSQNSMFIAARPKFVAIKSKTWLWMAFPLSCFVTDLIWRLLSRNRARVDILKVCHMPGRTISLSLSCPSRQFACRMGQYVLLQCLEISLIEWHPFTVVKLPSCSHRYFIVWIRITGDWTEALEKLLLERGPKALTMLVDGPFSSAMEGASLSKTIICVAAGVGLTPFVTLLRHMLHHPRSARPGRIHLIWIVRQECELSWLAPLANDTMHVLRNSNRPDRLHLELYVTNSEKSHKANNGVLQEIVSHIVAINENGSLTHNVITSNGKEIDEDEKIALLTPINKRYANTKSRETNSNSDSTYFNDRFNIAEKYPLLGCRVRRGRPNWDRLYGYWAHLYPKEHLNIYCCGPKNLVKLLRKKTKYISETTSTKLTFVYEGFS